MPVETPTESLTKEDIIQRLNECLIWARTKTAESNSPADKRIFAMTATEIESALRIILLPYPSDTQVYK